MPVALRCVKKVSVRQKVLFSLLSFSDFSGSKMRRTSGEHVCRSLFGSLAGEASTSFVLIITILREIEQLSRNELVWLNTYLAGRLRALPPASVHHSCPQLEVTTTAPILQHLALPVGLDPVMLLWHRYQMMRSTTRWTRGNAQELPRKTHLQQSLLPIQGYIQLRPQAPTPLPDFGTAGPSSPGDSSVTETAMAAPRRLGKASKSVSIFARDPLCKNTCRHCRKRPCDVGIEHDDHTCYDCEQQLLHPEGVSGAPWQLPLLPGCESWCSRCTYQRCAVREPHDLHSCMRCEYLPTAHPTPVGGGDPWASTPDL